MIHERLRRLRKESGLTQKYVAKKLGYQQMTYNHIENGKTKLDAELLPKLAKIIRVDACQFLKDENED